MNLNKIAELIKEVGLAETNLNSEIFKLATTPDSMSFAMKYISKINEAKRSGSKSELEKLKKELESFK